MTYLRGVDVSHYQSLTDWSPTGLSFVIAKASEGGVPDSMYKAHIAKGRKAGLVVGAYRADLPMAYQVDAFVAAAGAVDLYAIDVEEESIAGTQRFSVAQARDFMAKFRAKTGKTIGLYISESPYKSGGYSAAKADWLWIAKWSPVEPSVPFEFWQYRGSPLDLDRFNGTAADLAKLAGVPTAPDTGIPEDSMLLTDVTAGPGTATITADGPVWRCVDDVQVNVDAGASWDAVGTARYHHSAANPDGSLGYMFRANAPDGELHIVAASRCTFKAAPLPAPLPPDAVACKPFSDAAVAADRTKAYVGWKA